MLNWIKNHIIRNLNQNSLILHFGYYYKLIIFYLTFFMLPILGYIGFLTAFFFGTVVIYYTLLKVSLI